MSQIEDSASTGSASMSAAEFDQMHVDAAKRRIESGLRHGPCYSEGESAPLIWHDQVFAREVVPAGTVTCPTPLRAGSTQNGLDILLVASHANEANLQAAAGATVTLTLLQGDDPDGTFSEVGPTICVKAPSEGIMAEPDHTFARFPLGNFSKPWLKVKVDFSGTITGGNCDVALSYVAR